MKLKFYSLLVFCSLFSGCSWREYFLISNTSTVAITVTYKIAQVQKGFPIFYNYKAYKLNDDNDIDWNTKIEIRDTDTTLALIHVEIPPKCAFILGELNNDTYTKYNQHFINGRVFNLEKLEINTISKTTTILPENFDAFFKKSNGCITFEVK